MGRTASRHLKSLATLVVAAGGELLRTLPNQREVTVKGTHHLQEDSPNEIGQALREFVLNLGT